MCGINGIFAYGESAPPVDEAELLRTREHMIKRGPDGAGLWISPDRKVGLAHRRLAIIDLSESGAQPMATPDGRFTITFNGEIYNYRVLRRELEAKGYVFRSQSDTEVLLHLYADRGAEMVHALRGMFAFGIWDARERSFFLARDPFGIKPLYYSDNGTTLRFASQVKALLAGGSVSEAIEPAGYAGFFLWGSVPEPYTLYRGIRAVPAGHSLIADARGVAASRPFHSLRKVFAEAESMADKTPEPRRLEAIRDALEESVEQHLVADVPVGVFLSAGLDSAMLSGSAARHGPLHSITLGFDEYRGTASDETPLAEVTARAAGTRHETRWIGYERFRGELAGVLDAMDQPSIDGLNTWFVAAAAREAGMKVALSGLGGDELLASYPSFRQVPRMARLLKVARGVPALARAMRRVSEPVLRPFTSPKYAGLAEYGGTLAGAYLLRRALFMPWELPRLLDPDIAEAGLAELSTLARLDESIAGVSNPRLAVSCLEMSWYMKNQLLRDADWAGMAHSLEIRVPFADTALVAKIASLVAHPVAPSKREVARSVWSSIPMSVLERAKTGFTVPVRGWVERMGSRARAQRGLRGWAERVFAGVRRDRRVLMLATDLYGRTGGIAQFNRNLVRALCDHGRVRRLVVLPRNAGTAMSEIPRKLEHRSDASGSLGAFLAALLRVLMSPRRRFDLVICGHLNLLPFACLAKKLSGAKLLLVLHGIEAWYPGREALTRLFLPAVDAVSSVSRLTLERFEIWASVPRASRFLLPDCIDLARFKPGPVDAAVVERHRLEAARTVLTLARYDARERYKGVDEVLEVLPGLASGVPGLTYLIVGDGTDLPRLRAKAVQLGVDHMVRFAGHIPEDQKVAYYRSADVFAMPGRGEGFGIVYLEAAACGLPVVGSKLDASQEPILEAKLGAAVDPRDRAALGDALLQAFSRGKAVPEGIERFSFDRFSKRCGDVVDEIVAGRAAAG